MTIVSTEVDVCSSDPCQHSGVCVQSNGTFTCNCTTGYAGVMCENGKTSDESTSQNDNQMKYGVRVHSSVTFNSHVAHKLTCTSVENQFSDHDFTILVLPGEQSNVGAHNNNRFIKHHFSL